MTNDPYHTEYNAKARDAIMDLCPFYDPNHRCEIVRGQAFKDCLTEMRNRNRLALDTLRKLLEAEEATVEEFNAKEIDGLEAAMTQARRVLGILGHNDTAQATPTKRP
jgi:hypothetical protein